MVKGKKFTIMGSNVNFSVLVDMFEAISRTKKVPVKRKHLHTFFDYVYKGHEYFSALRLMLPELDKERSSYGLKETTLGRLITEALGLSKTSLDAKKLLEWRRGGKRAGNYAGNFPMVATEVIYQFFFIYTFETEK